MAAPYKTMDNADAALRAGGSENKNSHNKHASTSRSSTSYEADRSIGNSSAGGGASLHSLTFSGANFVDLRMTRPPEGMKPKPEKTAKKRVAKPAKTDEEAADEAADSRRRVNAMLRTFCEESDCEFKKDIDLHQYALDTGESVTNATVQELCIIQPNLTRLDMSHCEKITDASLWAIARHCTNIRCLVLSGCHQITNIGLRSLSLRCGQLETLDFTGCHLLDDLGLATVAGGCFNLTTLLLKNCSSITDTGIGRVAKACSKLKVLDMHGCTRVGEFGDHALKEIGAFCCQLRVLDLMGCRHVHDNGLSAIAVGCGNNLEVLRLSGCDGVTGTGLKALSKHCLKLHTLELVGCLLIGDRDVLPFAKGRWVDTLNNLSIAGCKEVTDLGVERIVDALGSRLTILNISGSQTTDVGVDSIVRGCARLRELNLSKCVDITNYAVRNIANGITCIYSLNLDGNPHIAPKVVNSYVTNRKLLFAELGQLWLGYQPKANVEGLIGEVEKSRTDLIACIKIQCLFRKKLACRRWREKYRIFLVDKYIPLVQAMWRSRKPYFGFKDYQYHTMRHRKAIVVQCMFRRFVQVCRRARKLKERKFVVYKRKCATYIQRVYRGMVGRKKVKIARNNKANNDLRLAKKKAVQEIKAMKIQCCFHGRMARNRVSELREVRRQKIAKVELELRSTQCMQRLARGFVGRRRAHWRREELRDAKMRWERALAIQRVYRGHVGRLRAKHERHLRYLRLINKMSTVIQTRWRQFRSTCIVAMLKALRELRRIQRNATVLMQRVYRGILGRRRANKLRGNQHEVLKLRWASTTIQKIFRGHKGREVAEIEKGLRELEEKAKPLFARIKQLEEDGVVMVRHVKHLEFLTNHSSVEIESIVIELDHASKTTNKLTDSSRINGIPQR
jgi:hypothetical protein